MEISGKIVEILSEKKGQSAKGPWRKQEYILKTDGQYPKNICFMAWADKIDEFSIELGENLIVSVDLESREYNGRWYTDVKAWKVARSVDALYSREISSTEGYSDKQPFITPKIDIEDVPF